MFSGSNGSQVSLRASSEVSEDQAAKTSGYIPGEKSGKWSEEEHMRYIAFIDFNKEKMRSREKRRSNKFYEQMAQFISSRNSLQCRSHHQKLEEKYTHANKIIALFKNHFSKAQYRKLIEQLELIGHDSNKDNFTRHSLHDRQTRDVEVQTDIQDLSRELVVVSPNLVVIQDKRPGPPHASTYMPPMMYPPPVYGQLQGSFQPGPMSYAPGHLGWWGAYPRLHF